MSNYAFYTAHGRIRELIIFDEESFVLPEWESLPEKKYEAIINEYKPVADKLNEDREILLQVYIMFTLMEPAGHGRWDSPDGRLTLIPVNSIDENANIPTAWCQDIMHIVPGEKLPEIWLNRKHECLPTVSPELHKVLKDQMKGYCWQLKDFSTLPTGGNLVRVPGGERSICFESIDINLMHRPQVRQRAGAMNVDENDYHVYGWRSDLIDCCPEILKRVVFHADQYITPIGELPGRLEYLILIPFLYPAKFTDEKGRFLDCIEELNNRFESMEGELRCDLRNNNVKCIPLPLYVLSFTTQPYGLCYNNCIVENYQVGDNRMIRVYFPDFSKSVSDYLNRVAQPENSARRVPEEIVDNIKVIAESLNLNKDFISSRTSRVEDVIELTDAVIKETHETIRIQLASFGIPEEQVHFVSMQFHENAQRLGGLHCRMKVINRDYKP